MPGSLEAHLVDIVVAELEGDGEDVLEDCFGFVYFGEGVELMGDFIPDSPLLRVLLQHKEDVDQVLPGCLLEELDELGQMRDGCQFQQVRAVLEDVVEGGEHVLLR